jgi:methylthioribose-1-phosphate isomerase
MIEAIRWQNDHLQLIDQRQLPEKFEYIDLYTIEEAFDAIRRLKVRGAPAIGITAAYGLYLGMRKKQPKNITEFYNFLDTQIDYLSQARPTAVNLFWAMDEIRNALKLHPDQSVDSLAQQLLDLAITIHEDDRQRCDAIANHGVTLIPNGAQILTHCNTGALATGGIGTALGIIYRAHENGKNVHVYADETRPVLQGARLTVWELQQNGVPVTLICDSMGAFLMQQNRIDCVIVGADRIAADGSVANKIGTYNLAVLANFHNIPFYVAAPLSTFDTSLMSGNEIPIESRSADEIRRVFGKTLITTPDAACWNPAFDVTPPELVTAIITESGILKPPYQQSIAEVFDGVQLEN